MRDDIDMGRMQDFDRRIRQGGDDAVRAALEYALTVAARWIPVGERLPKADADVLLTDGEEVVQAWFEEDDGWQAWHTSDNWRGAKAWMPLPEPPAL